MAAVDRANVLGRIRPPQRVRFGQRQPVGHVSVQRIVRRGLIGDDVGDDAAADQFGEDVRGVPFERDGTRDAAGTIPFHPRERVVEPAGALVDVAGREPALDPLGIHLDHERNPAVHRDGERLGAAHAAEPGGDDQPAREVAAEARAGQLGERLVRALQDALRADVDPAAGRHLPVHGEPAVLEVAKRVPRRPGRHEQRVGDEDPRRPGMRTEDGDGLAGLHDQGFVVLEPPKRGDDGVERGPAARGAAGSAVDDQLVGPFRHLRVEVVHQHPERGFLRPAFAGKRRTPRGADMTADDVHRRMSVCSSRVTSGWEARVEG